MMRPMAEALPLHRRRASALSTAALVLASAACGDADDAADVTGDSACCTTLAQAAERAGLYIGVASEPTDAMNAQWTALATKEFNAVSPGAAFVWDYMHPARDEWKLEEANAITALSEEYEMPITASHFVWDQATEVTGTPDWVKEIDDPDELRATLREHMIYVQERFGSKIQRWIVVNEPLSYFGKPKLHENHFHKVLGEDYIEEIFAIAKETAPDSELWLNEIFTEGNAEKSEGLVAFAAELLEKGVPMDGVGIQGHLFPTEPDFDVLEATLRGIGDLGLKTAITELDAPVALDLPDRPQLQAERMASAVRACLAVPACDAVTVWGLSDDRSWLNWLLEPGLEPLLFDAEMQPKPSYFAVLDALIEGRPD